MTQVHLKKIHIEKAEKEVNLQIEVVAYSERR